MATWFTNSMTIRAASKDPLLYPFVKQAIEWLVAFAQS